jgi:hypothetical protein
MSEPVQEPDKSTPDEPQEPVSEPPEEETDEEEEETAEGPGEAEGRSLGPAALTEREIEARHKKLEGEAVRHRNAVGRILDGDITDLVTCPLCLEHIPGYLFDPTRVPFPEDVKLGLEQLLGMSNDFVQDPKYEECPNCRGWGRTLSGARNMEHKTKLCDTCGGNGYVPKGSANVFQIPQPITNATVALPATYATHPSEGPDQWGRAPGHPEYGIDPNLVGFGR